VTTWFKNPTAPVTAVVAWAVGAMGATTAAAARAVDVLLPELIWSAGVVAAIVVSGLVVDGLAAVATASWASIEVAERGDRLVTGDDAVAALLAVDCVEFDAVWAAVDVACPVSGAEVAGGVLS
jgi:hypothetical protein